MGSTHYSLHYHWVCATKERRPFMRPDWRPLLHEYLGGTMRGLAGVPLKVGGVEDHVHALIGLKPTHCISDFVRELKKAVPYGQPLNTSRSSSGKKSITANGLLWKS